MEACNSDLKKRIKELEEDLQMMEKNKDEEKEKVDGLEKEARRQWKELKASEVRCKEEMKEKEEVLKEKDEADLLIDQLVRQRFAAIANAGELDQQSRLDQEELLKKDQEIALLRRQVEEEKKVGKKMEQDNLELKKHVEKLEDDAEGKDRTISNLEKRLESLETAHGTELEELKVIEEQKQQQIDEQKHLHQEQLVEKDQKIEALESELLLLNGRIEAAQRAFRTLAEDVESDSDGSTPAAPAAPVVPAPAPAPMAPLQRSDLLNAGLELEGEEEILPVTTARFHHTGPRKATKKNMGISQRMRDMWARRRAAAGEIQEVEDALPSTSAVPPVHADLPQVDRPVPAAEDVVAPVPVRNHWLNKKAELSKKRSAAGKMGAEAKKMRREEERGTADPSNQ